MSANDNVRSGKFNDLRILRDAERETLKMTGGEGSWLTTISFVKETMSPIFSMIEHVEETHDDLPVPEANGKPLVRLPIEYLVYRNKKNIRAFTKYNDVKMAIEHLNIEGTEIVIVLFAAFDNPLNPLIIESYFNPYYTDEDGRNTFMDDLRVIAHSSVQLFAGYSVPIGMAPPELSGMTFVEYTPEFKSKAIQIYNELQLSLEKKQTEHQFLKAKAIYQQTVPLDHRKINWLGDRRKLYFINESKL